MAGSTGSMQQPLTAASTTTVGNPLAASDATWATGDTLTILSLVSVNLKLWRPQGGDFTSSAATSGCVGWVQWVRIVDPSGTGASYYTHSTDSIANNVLSLCRIDPKLSMSSLVGRGGGGVQALGCTCFQAVFAQTGAVAFAGGGMAVGFQGQGGIANLPNTPVVHGGGSITGGTVIMAAGAFADGTIGVTNAILQFGAPFWGSFTINLSPQAALFKSAAGSWAANLLTSGALSFPGLTNGYTPPLGGTFTLNGVTAVNVAPAGSTHFPANAPIALALQTVGGTPGVGAPYFSAAQTADQFTVKSLTAAANDVYTWQALPALVALTPANLDLYASLRDPSTGARFCSAS
jgi:hypothetical protein